MHSPLSCVGNGLLTGVYAANFKDDAKFGSQDAGTWAWGYSFLIHIIAWGLNFLGGLLFLVSSGPAPTAA